MTGGHPSWMVIWQGVTSVCRWKSCEGDCSTKLQLHFSTSPGVLRGLCLDSGDFYVNGPLALTCDWVLGLLNWWRNPSVCLIGYQDVLSQRATYCELSLAISSKLPPFCNIKQTNCQNMVLGEWLTNRDYLHCQNPQPVGLNTKKQSGLVLG